MSELQNLLKSDKDGSYQSSAIQFLQKLITPVLQYITDAPNYCARLFAYGTLVFSVNCVFNLSNSLNFVFIWYEILGLVLFNRFDDKLRVEATPEAV